MPVASYLPQSPKGLAMTKLRRMVALSEAFQRRTGLGPSEAEDRVYIRSAPASAEMPFAIVTGPPLTWSALSGGSQNHMRPSGILALMLQCEPSSEIPATNVIDRRHEADDWFDEVVQDVALLSAADDNSSEDGTSHLAINSITPDGTTEETPDQTQNSTGVIYWGAWMIQWGYQG